MLIVMAITISMGLAIQCERERGEQPTSAPARVRREGTQRGLGSGLGERYRPGERDYVGRIANPGVTTPAFFIIIYIYIYIPKGTSTCS